MRLDDLREGLADDPRALRRALAELVQRESESAFGVWYAFGLVDGEPLPVEWATIGTDDGVFRRWLDERLPWPGGDPRLPDRRTVDRFVTMGAIFEGDALARTRLYQRCVAPMGVTDQARMMVYFRGRHVGWVGAMRGRGERPFEARVLRRLRALAPAIADAMVHADATARARDPFEGCDLVVHPAGRIELASAAAAPALAHPDRAALVRDWVRAADRGETPPPLIAGQRVRWARLSGRIGVRYLLHLEPVERVCLAPAFELSATQRRTAEHAAAGATVAEIGEAMGIAPSTVRTHLRVVYATLGVGSRAELARALAGPASS